MPTFRAGDVVNDRDALEKSLFSWIIMLNSAFTRSQDIRVWLHPTWKAMGLSSLGKNSGATMVEDDDIQDSLLSSALLITDYSSVAFDAAIAGTPVIFFQPDKKDYLKDRGIFFPFARNKKLLVASDQYELCELVNKMLTDINFRNYRASMDFDWASHYISSFDGMACERIFNAVEAK